MNGLTTTLVTVVIIVASAFFVAVEFSIMAAKRHRLEDSATRSRSARAALRSSSELSLLLAGSQLGITVCTLALGAVTKPAVHHALTPLLTAVGLPLTAADVVAFVLALFLVTFLHLVVGEMAPKSWAIAHPERSAILLALPMRAFMVPVRPVLRVLNSAANALVRKAGAEPVDELSSGQDATTLRRLVEHSAEAGTLSDEYRATLGGALDLEQLTLDDLDGTASQLTAVGSDATVAQVQEATRATGHLRILLGPAHAPTQVVHVRDTLTMEQDAPVAPVAREAFTLPATTPLHEALTVMRATSTQLVLTLDASGRAAGVVTLADILPRVLPLGVTDGGTEVATGVGKRS